MAPPWIMYAACLLLGAAAAAASYGGADAFRRVLSDVERDLSQKLRPLRVPTVHLHRWAVGWLVAVLVVFCSLALVLDNFVFAVLFAVLLLAAPWYLIRRLAQRRRQKIEDQLADAMVTLANAVRAGLSLPQSLEILAAQLPPPIHFEFRQIVAEYNLGKPLERVLREAKDRMRSENFALFAAALMASHESGGRLNETVERIAASVRELQRLDRKVMSETAQARKSAVYMALAPLIILVVYFLVAPENTVLLFTEIVGQMMLAAAVILNVLAYLWARAILNPDL